MQNGNGPQFCHFSNENEPTCIEVITPFLDLNYGATSDLYALKYVKASFPYTSCGNVNDTKTTHS
jgi:hypothetical protein